LTPGLLLVINDGIVAPGAGRHLVQMWVLLDTGGAA
jgi:hypothetical protein